MESILALLSDPAIWMSFLTLALLEIVLGVDNVIFISIIANKLPPEQRARARYLGLMGALIMRILLLLSITWIMKLTTPIMTWGDFKLSWKDVILIGGGLFLLYKATREIYVEVEGDSHEKSVSAASFGAVIIQIMIVDLVFSLDSVITAVGLVDHVEIMIAAVVLAILVMMVAANPIAEFINRHPSMKMLALAFLIMVGMVLVADGLHYHIEKAFIYTAMAFSIAVESLNLWRKSKRRSLDPGAAHPTSIHHD